MAKKIDKGGGDVIFAARARLGMTADALGAAIHRTGRLITMVEGGKCPASPYVVEAVRRLLIDRGLDAEPYSADELAAIRDYRQLSAANKAAVRTIIRGMIEAAPSAATAGVAAEALSAAGTGAP